MKNLKDKITNLAGILLLVGGGIMTASTVVALPAFLVTYSTVAAAIGGSIVAYATGKNPDLSSKTPEQIAAGLAPVMSPEATISAIQAASPRFGKIARILAVLFHNADIKPSTLPDFQYTPPVPEKKDNSQLNPMKP